MQAELAGKTGTTNNNTDGWFIGYSPQLLAGAWVGFNYNFLHFNSTYIGQGANTGLPIWALFMKKVFADNTLGITSTATFNLPAPPEGLNQFNYDPNLPPGQAVPNNGNGNASDYFDVDNNQKKNSSHEKAPEKKGKSEEPGRTPKALYPSSKDGK
jgi:penicillin-binding protein 1A